jgi:hypothetical protein
MGTRRRIFYVQIILCTWHIRESKSGGALLTLASLDRARDLLASPPADDLLVKAVLVSYIAKR